MKLATCTEHDWRMGFVSAMPTFSTWGGQARYIPVADFRCVLCGATEHRQVSIADIGESHRQMLRDLRVRATAEWIRSK